MEGANDAKNATIVVGADESSVSTTGFQASLESGKSSDFIKKAALKSIGDLGHSRARLKSDQAPTVVEILRSMKKRRNHETVILHSTERPHQSNGWVASCIRDLQSMVRTLKGQAFSSTRNGVTTTSPLLPWLVRHAGWRLSHYAAGRDGLTCHQRLHGKPFNSAILNFLGDVLVPEIADSRRRARRA